MGLAQCLAHSVCSVNVVGIYCYWQLLPRWQVVKDPPANAGDTWDPWVRKIFWNRKWQPTPVFLPGNPTDREAWRARVHRVTRSRIWLSGPHPRPHQKEILQALQLEYCPDQGQGSTTPNWLQPLFVGSFVLFLKRHPFPKELQRGGRPLETKCFCFSTCDSKGSYLV